MLRDLGLAHEFFHVLQYAHTGGSGRPSRSVRQLFWDASWYCGSERHGPRGTTRRTSKTLYDSFRGFQDNDVSLLEHSAINHQYGPGSGRSSRSCRSAPRASTRPGRARSRRAISQASTPPSTSHLPFEDSFRDFSVRNLNPVTTSPEATGPRERSLADRASPTSRGSPRPAPGDHRPRPALGVRQGQGPRGPGRHRFEIDPGTPGHDRPRVRSRTRARPTSTSSDGSCRAPTVDQPTWSRIRIRDDD